MSVHLDHLLRLMWREGGAAPRERGAHILAVYPRGDRRRRPMAWLDAVDAQEWTNLGLLCLGERGYTVAPDIRRALAAGQSPREIVQRLKADSAAQDTRQAVVLPQVETMDRLRDSAGRRVFSDAQVEAARRFHRDLHRAGQAGGASHGPATSDIAVPQVDGSRRHDRVEAAMARRIDAGRAVARAKRGLDRRVVRVLTRVIAADEPLDAVDHAQGWTPGVGATLMQIGLDHLIRHYGVRLAS